MLSLSTYDAGAQFDPSRFVTLTFVTNGFLAARTELCTITFPRFSGVKTAVSPTETQSLRFDAVSTSPSAYSRLYSYVTSASVPPSGCPSSARHSCVCECVHSPEWGRAPMC
jgi:hypothetical protein